MLAASQVKYFSHLGGEDQREAAQDISRLSKDIVYSKRYSDETHEYRHVLLPKQIARWLPKEKLMDEDEWRAFGVVQSPGWEHYMIHTPEPHILLFKRQLETSGS